MEEQCLENGKSSRRQEVHFSALRTANTSKEMCLTLLRLPILFSREDFPIANTVGQVKDWGRSNRYNLHISIHKEQNKFEHGGLLASDSINSDISPSVQSCSVLARRRGIYVYRISSDKSTVLNARWRNPKRLQSTVKAGS
jgi:hypothetical protein